MTDTSQAPGPIRQAQLVRQVSQAAVREIAPGWDRVRYVARMTREVSGFEAHVYQDGSETTILSADEADDLAYELRSVMYRPGTGTWFTFALDITPDGQAKSTFDYDNEPDIPHADPTVYLNEQEKFPRDPDHQPGWYVERLTEGERLLAERVGLN